MPVVVSVGVGNVKIVVSASVPTSVQCWQHPRSLSRTAREKLIRGIRIACAKRPVSANDIERLVGEIETKLQAMERSEVSSRIVGDMVIAGVKELDQIAYIRYAIVYLGLDDLHAIRKEIDRLLEG